MHKNTFYKYSPDGLITLLSAPTQGINHTRQLTEEELDEKVEIDNFWQDRKHDREEWS